MAPDYSCAVPLVFLFMALIFGFMTLLAKEKWRDRRKTQLFAVIAIMGTVGFIMWTLIYL